MDGTDVGLFPFLPYIFQDLWELGSNPEVIISLIGDHFTKCDNLKVLDLGCGKGAVSIKAAKALGCQCHGIDAVPEFITYAQNKAVEYNVVELCRFEVGDIREKVKSLHNFDVIILGSIGPVFGNYYTTLSTLSQCLNDSGIIIMDDGYIENDSKFTHPLMHKQATILAQIQSVDMELIGKVIADKNKIKDSDNFIIANLEKRCLELVDRYPQKRALFLDYIRKQYEENNVLENDIICSTMVIRKIK
jgi:cyclopropane fatty-acyl-phospholipid synthase-like methyltransferase